MARSGFHRSLLVAVLLCSASLCLAAPQDDTFGYAAQHYFGGRYAAAQTALEPLIAAGSDDPRAWYFHGLAAWQSGDQQQAATDFQRGAELEKSSPKAMPGVGTCLERVQGAPRQALEQYRATARVESVRLRQVARLDRYRTAMQIAQGGAAAPAASVASAPAQPAAPPVETTAAAEPASAPAAPAMTNPAVDPFAAPAAPAAAATPAAPTTPAADPFTAPAQPAMPAAAPATPAEPAPPADSPAATVSAALAAIDQPEQLWDLLPARYQSDITSIVSKFGTKMDPEIWTQAFAVLNKLNRLAATKRELIMKQPALAALPIPGGADAMKEGWDGAVHFFDAILTSDLSSVDALKNFDAKHLLATTGRRLVVQIGQSMEAGQADGLSLEKLKAAKVRVKNAGETTATVTITPEGQPAIEVRLTKADDKWLPTAMVEGWDQQIAAAKEGVAKLDLAAQKPQIMGGLAMADGVLEQLLNAKDEAEFNKALGPIMALLGGLGGAAPPAAAPPAAPPNP